MRSPLLINRRFPPAPAYMRGIAMVHESTLVRPRALSPASGAIILDRECVSPVLHSGETLPNPWVSRRQPTLRRVVAHSLDGKSTWSASGFKTAKSHG